MNYREYRERREYERSQEKTKQAAQTNKPKPIRDSALKLVMQEGESIERFEVRRRLRAPYIKLKPLSVPIGAR